MKLFSEVFLHVVFNVLFKKCFWPWPVWFSWLGIIPQSERSWVQFPVMAPAEVAGLSPVGATDWCFLYHVMFPSLFSPSLPVSLKIHLKKCFYIELYTWNLYNFINHCHPQKRQVGKKRKINKNFFISIYSQNCIYHFSLNTKDQNVVRWLHVSARQAKQWCLLTRCSCAHRKCWQGRRAVRMDTGARWTQLTTVLITYNTWLLCHK